MKFLNFAALLISAAVMANAQTPPIVVIDNRLFGWADLHAHPASHLAFGSDTNGEHGIFWGKPGGHWQKDYSKTNADMPPCSFKHGGNEGDVVRHETHKALMETLDSVTNYPHQTADFGENNHGAPSYDHWPYARSVSHQQMHVTQMRRAYEGGQRLMIASVTDNEFLTDMWTKVGYNAGGNPVPAIDPDFGFNSAVKQIKFIKSLVDLNSGWMQIASSAADARKIIAADKLAIILSIEMDTLTAAQVLKLVDDYGVRHVIPIHLINNDFGGTAVYSDAFNAVNDFVHSTREDGKLNLDGFLRVAYDKSLDFRLGWPKYPRPEGFNLVKGGAMNIDPVPNTVYVLLGYNSASSLGGHRNKLGLSDAGFELLHKLALRGVLIDVAHMSYKSTGDALGRAMRWGYPVMNSHTNFREADGSAHSERDLHRDHAKLIAKLGGVVGLGTEWDKGFETLYEPEGQYYILGYNATIPGDPNDPSWYQHTFKLNEIPGSISQLRLTIETGKNDLSKNLNAIINVDGKTYTFLLNKSHETWRPGLITTPTIELPVPIPSSKLRKITLRVDHGAFWAMHSVKIEAVPYGRDPISTWLARYNEGLNLMDGKGMAIGTDINGFAPQLYLPADQVKYPITVAHSLAPSSHTPLLQKAQLGSKTYDFRADGIAHYGMLPDFLQALNQQPNSARAVDSLFHSANDVVEMWEKCAKRAKDLQTSIFPGLN